MDIGRYVAQLRDDLAAAAAPGDEQTQRTAALLGAAVEPAARLALMNALADLAAEITDALGDRTVEVRLDGRDVRVAVGSEPAGETAPPPPPPPRGSGMDSGDISRITLRLVEQIKGQAEQAAASQGVSLNSWVAQAVQGALSGQSRRRRGPWGEGPGGPGAPRRPGGRPPPPRLGAGVTGMAEEGGGLVREENRPVAGPVELDVAVDVGRVEIHLEDRAPESGTADGGRSSDATAGAAAATDASATAASTTPASTTPASTTPASTTPASSTPASSTAASSVGGPESPAAAGQRAPEKR